ncbi:hypothetical protein [Pseudoalteromonas aurantia]|uniref:Uncharacterized protein n=1 Tax=Pseudoalteromonas aurantia 208 TaxID=1314867 RepID=A0ABR9E9I6_9GAMM|nr:hypothetical protein [Pseudoalteromonas aurantia]MBE0366438.1 hypothetical protein [Pseudoalteromonas aurantia 208]
MNLVRIRQSELIWALILLRKSSSEAIGLWGKCQQAASGQLMDLDTLIILEEPHI